MKKHIEWTDDSFTSVFPDQLQSEPHISRIHIDSFDGRSVYTAAQNQNSCFYEEGIKDFYGFRTKEKKQAIMRCWM